MGGDWGGDFDVDYDNDGMLFVPRCVVIADKLDGNFHTWPSPSVVKFS